MCRLLPVNEWYNCKEKPEVEKDIYLTMIKEYIYNTEVFFLKKKIALLMYISEHIFINMILNS